MAKAAMGRKNGLLDLLYNGRVDSLRLGNPYQLLLRLECTQKLSILEPCGVPIPAAILSHTNTEVFNYPTYPLSQAHTPTLTIFPPTYFRILSSHARVFIHLSIPPFAHPPIIHPPIRYPTHLSSGTVSSSVYPGYPECAAYCPNTTSSISTGLHIRSSFVFSFRTSSPSKLTGRSIANRHSICTTWF